MMQISFCQQAPKYDRPISLQAAAESVPPYHSVILAHYQGIISPISPTWTSLKSQLKPAIYFVQPMFKCQHTKFNQNKLICTISMSDLFTKPNRSKVCIGPTYLLACYCFVLFFEKKNVLTFDLVGRVQGV